MKRYFTTEEHEEGTEFHKDFSFRIFSWLLQIHIYKSLNLQILMKRYFTTEEHEECTEFHKDFSFRIFSRLLHDHIYKSSNLQIV